IVETVNKESRIGEWRSCFGGSIRSVRLSSHGGDALRMKEFKSMVDGGSKLVQTHDDGMGIVCGSLRKFVGVALDQIAINRIAPAM
ncbi:hypothetical protein ACIPR8_19340, partial [Stenotrophomonas sp. LARHCG68]